jgi:serine/threonine-protein kinase RsbW
MRFTVGSSDKAVRLGLLVAMWRDHVHSEASSLMDSPRPVPPGAFADITIPSDAAVAHRLQEEVESQLKQNHFSDHEIFGIKLALEEALVNAIKHGNQMDQAKKIHISYCVLPERFEIHITDEGPGFDPCDVPDPTDVENLERPCGRGLMLMRHYMSEVRYTGRGNSVSMSKVARNGRK